MKKGPEELLTTFTPIEKPSWKNIATIQKTRGGAERKSIVLRRKDNDQFQTEDLGESPLDSLAPQLYQWFGKTQVD